MRFQLQKRRRHAIEDAFSLLELLMVVVILGIVASTAMVRFSGSYAKMRLHQRVDDIAMDMRYVQSLAIRDGRPIRMMLDAVGNTYWFVQAAASFEDELIPTITADYQALEGRWGRRFSIAEELSFAAEIPYIEFFSDGQITRTQMTLCPTEECVNDPLACQASCLVISTLEQRGTVSVLWQSELGGIGNV